MAGMDQFLAQFYGTNGTPKTAAAAAPPPAAAQVDFEKEATVQLFIKTASDQNIDLKAMTNDQVAQLFAHFESQMGKQAGEEPEEEKKKKELEAKAKQEHEEKKAQVEKIAEADALGRVMAHAFVDEMKKVGAANGAAPAAAAATKVAELPPALAAHMKGGKGEGEDKDKDKEKKEHEKEAARRAGTAKQASALDTVAGYRALDLMKQANYAPADIQTVAERIGALFTLGQQGESTKIASAADYEGAVHIRALELLEKAGLTVDWKA